MTPKQLAARARELIDAMDGGQKILRAADEIGVHHMTLRTFLAAPEQVGEDTRLKVAKWIQKGGK